MSELKVEYIKTSELIPYANNPRHNDDAVDYVANSIREFGFKVPIVIDKDKTIVAGHTRLKAAKKIGMKEVPCIIADDLTEQQIQAFRLADNKVSELATWDMDLLDLELDGITDIDMGDFGFDLDISVPDFENEDDDGYYGDAREKTYNSVNLNEYDESRTQGFYNMPIIKKCNYIPENLIGFNYAKTAKETNVGVHFFIDDYQFERIWNSPQLIIERLKKFQCVFTPDWSLYMDMPMAMKIWNVYRSRLIGQMCQDAGIKVIPTLSWAEKETYQFCFDGLEQGGTVAVSTVGVMRDKKAKEIWVDGMKEAMARLQPKQVILYGSEIDFDFGNAEVKHFQARKFGE